MKASKNEIVRIYRIGNDHQRIFLREETRKAKTCTKRRISETDGGTEVFEPVNLNALAAALPKELEGQWIVEVVRGFGAYRGIHCDAALRDTYQEAVATAIKAAREAIAKGGDRVAFVKRAVRARLTDLQRRTDYRDARMENDENKVIVRNPFGDFRSAVRLLSPQAKRIWYAYRKSRGVMSRFAAILGTSDYLAETRFLPILAAEMKDALAFVKCIRGKRF